MSTPESTAAGLLADRFIEVSEFKNLRVGMRVRHGSQQWPDAHLNGTGTIERIFHQPDSAWERSWGRPNVELIVKRDKPEWGPNDTHMYVADYHVDPAEVQP